MSSSCLLFLSLCPAPFPSLHSTLPSPPSSLLEAAVVEKGLLEGRWNVAGLVSQSEDNDGLFVTEGLGHQILHILVKAQPSIRSTGPWSPTRLGIQLQDLALPNEYSLGYRGLSAASGCKLAFTTRHYRLFPHEHERMGSGEDHVTS